MRKGNKDEEDSEDNVEDHMRIYTVVKTMLRKGNKEKEES